MNFLERFKGKTERMPSKGIIDLISNNSVGLSSQVLVNRNQLSSLQKLSLGNQTNSQMPSYKHDYLSLTSQTQPQSPTYNPKSGSQPQFKGPSLPLIREYVPTITNTVKLPQINQQEKRLEFDLVKMQAELENLKLKRELVKGSRMDQSQKLVGQIERADTEINLVKSAIIQRKSDAVKSIPLRQSRHGTLKYSDRMKHSFRQNARMVLETKP